jgi:hypothetical protein
VQFHDDIEANEDAAIEMAAMAATPTAPRQRTNSRVGSGGVASLF